MNFILRDLKNEGTYLVKIKITFLNDKKRISKGK